MTSEPTATFPLNLIQNSVKMTYERPKGLKANLLNSYQTGLLNSNFYDSCPKQDKLFKQMLYLLTFFDVVVNERRKYGCVGWNFPYDFSISDYTESIRQLQMFLCDRMAAPFKTLQYIISECFYGGRIVDKFDKRSLKTILNDIFNENILEGPPYKISSLDSHALPLRYEHRLIVKFIEEAIPEKSNCEVYGLHENSEFILHLNQSNSLLSSMTIAMANKNKKSMLQMSFLEKLNEINEKLPFPVDLDEPNKFGFSYKNSMNIVLTSEIKMFNKLLDLIRKTCFKLQQSIQGEMRNIYNLLLGEDFNDNSLDFFFS